jgi:hypothetical protein
VVPRGPSMSRTQSCRVAGLAIGRDRRCTFARRARRGNEAPTMNRTVATILADGIYIGGGVILVILVILVVLLLMRRGV